MVWDMFILCWLILGCVIAIGIAGIVFLGTWWLCNEIRRAIKDRL